MRRLQVVLILTQRDFGPMFHAERRAHRTGKVYADDADKDMVRGPYYVSLLLRLVLELLQGLRGHCRQYMFQSGVPPL